MKKSFLRPDQLLASILAKLQPCVSGIRVILGLEPPPLRISFARIHPPTTATSPSQAQLRAEQARQAFQELGLDPLRGGVELHGAVILSPICGGDRQEYMPIAVISENGAAVDWATPQAAYHYLLSRPGIELARGVLILGDLQLSPDQEMIEVPCLFANGRIKIEKVKLKAANGQLVCPLDYDLLALSYHSAPPPADGGNHGH